MHILMKIKFILFKTVLVTLPYTEAHNMHLHTITVFYAVYMIVFMKKMIYSEILTVT